MRELTKTQIHQRLLEPFPLRFHEVKPGAGGGKNGQVLALPFVPWHHYQARLDAVVGWENWGADYKFLDQETVSCSLTILGVVKVDVGEVEEEDQPPSQNNQPQKRRGANPLFGGVAQAFRRACASFGLGRYLYELDRYYAPFSDRKITEEASQIIFKLLQRAGLDPFTRHKAAIMTAQSIEELQEVGNLIAYSALMNDLQDTEKKQLKSAYQEKKATFGGGSGGSSAPNSPTTPATPAPTTAPSSALAEPTPKFAGSSEAVTPEERGISEDIQKCDINATEYQANIRRAIDNKAKQGLLTAYGVMRLLEAFRKKFPLYGKESQKPKPGPLPAPPLRPAPTGLTSDDIDKAEQKARGDTTEEREASYNAEIDRADQKLLDCLGPEIQKDRLLVSSAMGRLAKRIEKRRQSLPPSSAEAAEIHKRIAEAPRLSQGVSAQPVATDEPAPSAAAAAWAGVAKRCQTELELEEMIGDSARATDLCMRDLDWLEPIINQKRDWLKAAAATQATMQRPLL